LDRDCRSAKVHGYLWAWGHDCRSAAEDVVAACWGERAKQRQQGVARRAGRGAVGQELEDVDQTGHQALLGPQDEAVGRAVLARQAVLRKTQVFAAKLVRLAGLRPEAS
jgi:hypothetical protein